MNRPHTHPQPRRSIANGSAEVGAPVTEGGLFDDVLELPDPQAADLYHSLVGLAPLQERLRREGQVLLRPALVDVWLRRHHPNAADLAELVRRRSPLFLFEGDVGTGKTVLARTFGDLIAREHKITVRVYVLSLNARGSGAVGEMTKLIAAAFTQARAAATASAPVVLLIDEADALAQSRGTAQMHHEDRAGVNALIRGLDGLAGTHHPVLVVMSTNRLDAIDPAVRRRAAGTFRFERPNLEQRLALLSGALAPAGFEPKHIKVMAEATGDSQGRGYGCTYSDLTQRLLPGIVLDALPDEPLQPEAAIAAAKALKPTPPFRAGS